MPDVESRVYGTSSVDTDPVGNRTMTSIVVGRKTIGHAF